MNEISDEKLIEIFKPLSETKSFITDSTRRDMIRILKKHNFITFNILQPNIYSIAGVIVISIVLGLSFLGNSGSEESKPMQQVVEAPQKAKIKKEAEPKKTPAVQKKKTDGVFHGIPKVTGMPDLINLPKQKIATQSPLFPKIPDSLPKLKLEKQVNTINKPVAKQAVVTSSVPKDTVKKYADTVKKAAPKAPITVTAEQKQETTEANKKVEQELQSEISTKSPEAATIEPEKPIDESKKSRKMSKKNKDEE